MKTIPIHDFAQQQQSPKFEVDLWKKSNKYDVSLPHRHNYCQALIFLKGGGKHEIDFNAYVIKSQSLHFVYANQVHVVRRAAGSTGFSIMFAEEFLPEGCSVRDFYFFKTGACPVMNLRAKDFSEIKATLESIQTEYFSHLAKKREVLQALFHVFLIQAQRLQDKTEKVQAVKSSKHEFAEQLEQLIEKNFQLHWRAHDYARPLNVSVTQLNFLCKQHFSKSTETLIQDRLLLEAKRLLVYSEKSVKEICFDLNFDDPAYFIRFFRKHTGITPLEYRKSVGG